MGPEEIEATKRNPEKLKIYLRDYYSKTNPDASDEEVDTFVETNVSEYAVGGRVGLESGTPKKGLESISIKDMDKFLIKGPYKIRYDEDGNPIRPEFPRKGEPHKYNPDKKIDRKNMPFILPLKRNKSAFGGLQSMPMGQMRRNQAGTIERDYRETGGFVPVGIKEKADDVPAMLSKNEFVMTADAVRGMGDGNIEKGAQRLYDQMKTSRKESSIMADVTETRILPPEFIEAAGKTYLGNLGTAAGDYKTARSCTSIWSTICCWSRSITSSSSTVSNSRYWCLSTILNNSRSRSNSSRCFSWTSRSVFWSRILSTIYVSLSTGCY